jgi:hypothetical protein
MDKPQGPEFGYRYYPSEKEDDLGHPRLDVLLAEVPSGRHFDPERAEFPVVSARNEIQPLAVEHPWTLLNHYRVTAGRIFLYDRLGKVHEAFTYGGELMIETAGAYTRCVYTSPAPILELDLEDTAASLLGLESEILLAERRAAWGLDQAGFETRLAGLEPFRLFAACVLALREKLRRLPPTEDPETRSLLHYLSVESGSMRQRGLSAQALSLKDIL